MSRDPMSEKGKFLRIPATRFNILELVKVNYRLTDKITLI